MEEVHGAFVELDTMTERPVLSSKDSGTFSPSGSLFEDDSFALVFTIPIAQSDMLQQQRRIMGTLAKKMKFLTLVET